MPSSPNDSSTVETAASDFIRDIVAEDRAAGRGHGRVVTRFPPEPNGYLHIGHAKSICLNFGIAGENADAPEARCHLRFDDTNPLKEEQAYVEAIREDVRWLGFDWGEHEHYASDYFDQLYEWAILLVKAGEAYVDDQSAERIRESRGTLTRPGVASAHRRRSVEENLDLLERMKRGAFAEGEKVLRAKIDMASPNLNLRDPVMYRILRAPHPRTGDTWSIYPTYDWAHGQSDWIEGVTHSLCTLEFEDHRPLYDWFLDRLREAGTSPSRAGGRTGGGQSFPRPRQVEFARLNLTHMITSKRKLADLVREGRVEGWDDPRMPTLAGMRRRGYTPRAIRTLCRRIGVTKYNATTEIALLDHCLREDLNQRAPRRLAVLDPLKVTLTNYPEQQTEELEAVNNPEDASAGTRMLPFSRELYIERSDFMEDPPRKFKRLGPGREVRLRYGYFITCQEAVKNKAGELVELRCTYDPETRGGDAPDGRKPKGTIHWVSAVHAMNAQVRLYDHLLTTPDPDQKNNADSEKGGAAGGDWRDHLNPDSLRVVQGMLEPSLRDAPRGEVVQFERIGYFVADAADFSADDPVFNRTIGLKDTWGKKKK